MVPPQGRAVWEGRTAFGKVLEAHKKEVEEVDKVGVIQFAEAVKRDVRDDFE
jgi:hypothetical protein